MANYKEIAGFPTERLMVNPLSGSATYEGTRKFLCPADEVDDLLASAFSGNLPLTIATGGKKAYPVGYEVHPIPGCLVGTDDEGKNIYSQYEVIIHYGLFWESGNPIGPYVQEALTPLTGFQDVFVEGLGFVVGTPGRRQIIPAPFASLPVLAGMQYEVTYANTPRVAPQCLTLAGCVNAMPVAILRGSLPIAPGCLLYTGCTIKAEYKIATATHMTISLNFRIRGFDWNKEINPVTERPEYRAKLVQLKSGKTEPTPFIPYPYANLAILLP